jgi:hypothetical protein
MSLKSAIVMYRVDGVSGLKCLTGINAKVFLSATLKLAGHHSCPCWESVIGPQTCCPDDLADDEERVNYQMQNRMQAIFERILGLAFLKAKGYFIKRDHVKSSFRRQSFDSR